MSAEEENETRRKLYALLADQVWAASMQAANIHMRVIGLETLLSEQQVGAELQQLYNQAASALIGIIKTVRDNPDMNDADLIERIAAICDDLGAQAVNNALTTQTMKKGLLA